MSVFFETAVRVRHALYDRKFLPVKRAPLPVVSIGNIVAGGVGKTQVVLLLAEALKKKVRVAILSRGYKGAAEKRKNSLVVDVTKHRPEECGDEPWLLASRLPEVDVVVNRDRHSGAQEAKRLGAEVVLLDDGMQHRALHRDLEIVVIDSADPFGGGRFLPWGRLRELPKRLACADLVVSVGPLSAAMEQRVASYTAAPIIEVGIVATSHGPLKGERVGVFCGVGNPKRFVQTVKELGAEVVATLFLPDHRPIGERRLRRFAALAKKRGAKLLLCTEKDKVKLPAVEPELPIPVDWVKGELEIMSGRHPWDAMIEKITGLIR